MSTPSWTQHPPTSPPPFQHQSQGEHPLPPCQWNSQGEHEERQAGARPLRAHWLGARGFCVFQMKGMLTVRGNNIVHVRVSKDGAGVRAPCAAQESLQGSRAESVTAGCWTSNLEPEASQCWPMRQGFVADNCYHQCSCMRPGEP